MTNYMESIIKYHQKRNICQVRDRKVPTCASSLLYKQILDKVYIHKKLLLIYEHANAYAFTTDHLFFLSNSTCLLSGSMNIMPTRMHENH